MKMIEDVYDANVSAYIEDKEELKRRFNAYLDMLCQVREREQTIEYLGRMK